MNRVGRFMLVSQLKRGAQSTTYKAYDPETQQFVIVKMATDELVPSEEAARKIAREAEIYAKNRHENIVAIIDYGSEGFHPYLVLEYIEGATLRQLVATRFALPVVVVLYCLEDILQGLARLHESGLIHRDLKPENLILSSTGRVKICDFDLASAQIATAENTAGLTGSAGYMAPEVIYGKSISPRSDIFSVGVLTYELLTASRPFQAPTPTAEVQAIINREPLPASRLNKDVPDALLLFISRCLEKDPRQRLENAGQALEALHEVFRLPAGEERRTLLARWLNSPEACTLPELSSAV